MSTNAQGNQGAADRDSTLRNLEGNNDKPKTIDPADRSALTEALMDQNTINQLEASGRSSQNERRRKREAAGGRKGAGGQA
jgi:hypothetical protein